ncbi:MFS transporter [Methylobacterium sp. J-070]|uniref:MFS transporter n=1 Tax=Methylobacterium sp. J-070 TaxID=2836650 RepID=UPI001FB86D96|nr:MFS transporter [Methylobacterium sp. J-070]MCJ2048467.1 MFS transporter [Methylobacterium sp. J-070]
MLQVSEPPQSRIAAPITTTYTYANQKWVVLIGVSFCYLFYYLGRQTFGFAVPGIQRDLNLSKEALGWVSASMLWAYALGQSINGNLGDKYGGRKLMLAGAVLSFAANWATSFATGFIPLLVAWALNGYFQSMGFAPGSRLLSNWWGHKNRGFVYSFYVGASGFSSVLAYLVPIVVLGHLHLEWPWVFRLCVPMMLVGALVMYFAVNERPEDVGLEGPADDKAPAERAEAESSAASTSRERYLAVLRNWRLYATGVSIGCQNAARYALIVWVPVHFLGPNWKAGAGGIDPIWITLALPIGMAFGASTNSWVSDIAFRSRRYLAIITYMLLAAAVALVMEVLPQGSAISVAALLLCGFFVFGPASSFWALCPDIFGRRLAGTATGLLNFMSYACAGVGEPIIGHLMDNTGNTAVIFPIVACLCLGSAGSALIIRR